jgi:hypothetical protein
MMTGMNQANGKPAHKWLARCCLVLAGLVLGQAILIGPSLIGQKILLPLDILARPNIYLPPTPQTVGIVPQNSILGDLIAQFEPARRFAASELHQGRFPLWAPYQYGGVPFVWPKFSVFLLLESCFPSPVILAWAQLFAALVAGLGMYCFCRHALRVGFWPAAVCAWCYPLTAFFVLWQGYPTALAVYWLPWILLAADKTARDANAFAGIGLSLATFLVLTSGHLDVAGQVLMGAGLYALWCLWDEGRARKSYRKIRGPFARLALGFALGFFLAAPHILPLLEYVQTGSRMIERSQGAEERPPTGLRALPQVVLPDLYGTTDRGSTFIAYGETNLPEGASAGYAGVFATLLVAPLAWCSRRHRAINVFWILLAFFGLSWSLDVPGFVQLLRLPVLKMMSHNRLVFLTAFAILALAAIGLNALWEGRVERRWWFWLPAAVLAVLFGWCVFRCVVLPYPIATQAQLDGLFQYRGAAPTNVEPIQEWFSRHYARMAELCVLGFLGWLVLWSQTGRNRRLFTVFAICLVGDLLWFDYGRSVQCDPVLYFPRIPVLAEVAQSVPGRVIGFNCLPAALASMQGLSDIRGYDSIDPGRMVALVRAAAVPDHKPSYAAIQTLSPMGGFTTNGAARLMPALDLLDVRYVIFRGVPTSSHKPAFQDNDYWVAVNSNAVTRAFIPQSVKMAADDAAALAAVASPKFRPAAVAYVETPVELPAACRGTARIVKEIPTHVTLSVQMDTPGLVVLADNWDKGWRAYWNGRRVPVLRADYTIRGVVLPAGSGTLEFVYRPASLMLGCALAIFAVAVLLAWLAAVKIGFRFMQKETAG